VKKISLMRHGDNATDSDFATHGIWQPQSKLTKDGAQQLTELRDNYFVDKKYQISICSPFDRTRQTGEIILPNNQWVVEDKLVAEKLEKLDTIYKTQNPATIGEIEALLPGFCKDTQTRIMSVVEQTLNDLKSGKEAIIIGHEPSLTLALSMFDKKFDAYTQLLPKAGICVLSFSDDNVFLSCEELT